MRILRDGEVRFPDVVLIPIVAVAIVSFIFFGVLFWNDGYDKGSERAKQRIAKDCDRIYGGFNYRDEEGNIYSFNCSFDKKIEKKPWDNY